MALAAPNLQTLTPFPSANNPIGAAYKPKAHRTKGVRLACLVNASVTGCPDNTIYAFGGFDQFTDEVYNHVLRLDLQTFTWTLVDNFGDIPSVRMGHTTTYWRDNKLVIFGGENEHRTYLSDIYIFDIITATWSQPAVQGPIPRGRSRHSVTLHDEKLFVLGGMCGTEVLDDVSFLDLTTMTWSRSWKFVGRFDHTSWVHKNRLYVFGGLTQDMDRSGELCWLDLQESPAWKTQGTAASNTAASRVRSAPDPNQQAIMSSSPLQAHALVGSYNGGPHHRHSQITVSAPAPGTINAVRFLKGPHIPSEAIGNHFHHFGGSTLLDFVTPANTIRDHDTSLSALDLDSLAWRTLADGDDVFVSANYRWHYLAISPDQSTAYLLGCPSEGNENEYLSDILPIDLKRYGVVQEKKEGEIGSLGSLGFDLSSMFDEAATSDFVVTAMSDSAVYGEEEEGVWSLVAHPSTQTPQQNTGVGASTANSSPPIHVHKLILRARWPHFNRLYNARMSEFHSGKLFIPEPYSVVKAFLYYLYTDSIATSPYCLNLSTVAGLLVLSNIYQMPQLRALSVSRILKELNVESAAVVWERAGTAGEESLKTKAARFCMTHWGRVVRTDGFMKLSKRSMLELCQEVDLEGRVLNEDELESVNGLGGNRILTSSRLGHDDDEGDEGMDVG